MCCKNKPTTVIVAPVAASAAAGYVGALKALESQYTWFGHVSSGSYGSVYAGKTKTAPFTRVAAKVILGNANGTMCAALRELRASLCTVHVGIVSPREVHVLHDATVVIIMSLYDGTVRDVILRHNSRRPRFTLREAAWIFASVARGLREAHRYGFTHRDIKPENIFVRDSDVCLGDWGLGRDTVRARARVGALTPHVISTWYAPPEVLRVTTAYTPAVDVWSIGMLLLELLADANLSRSTRRESFFDDTITRLVGPVDGSRRFEALRNTLRRDVPSDVIELLSGMLAYDASARIGIEDVCKHRFVMTADVSTATAFPVVSNRVTRTRYHAVYDYDTYGSSKVVTSFIPKTMPPPVLAAGFPPGMFSQTKLLSAWQKVTRMRQAAECWVLVLSIAHALGNAYPWPDVTPLQTLGVFFLLAFHSVVVVPQHITADKVKLCDGMTLERAADCEADLLRALHGAVPHAPNWFTRVPPRATAFAFVGVAVCLTDAPITVTPDTLLKSITVYEQSHSDVEINAEIDADADAVLFCRYAMECSDSIKISTVCPPTPAPSTGCRHPA